MSRIRQTTWVLTGLVLVLASSDALAVHFPKGWTQRDRVQYTAKDQVHKGAADTFYFVMERPGTWKNGPNLLIFTGFEGFCVFQGKEEGLRLHPVSAGRIIRAGFGRDPGMTVGLFDKSFKRLFEVKIEKPEGDAFLWIDTGTPERAVEVLSAHLAMGTALTQETRGMARLLRRYSKTLNDPLYTYLYNLYGKDRDWLNPRWEGRPEEVDPPRRPHTDRPPVRPDPQDPGPQAKPFEPGIPALPHKVDTLIRNIDNAAFSGDKLSLVEMFFKDNWVTVEAATRILPRFAFSSDRLKALEHMAGRLTDRDNSYLLLNSFEFSSDKEAAKKILEDARR